ncbi:CsbD family protein [Eupransor demetentiae]|uniref:CsbD family protein n=1 Tax=Eupransor demetentiae TaxID=3109584 RepID=A0ABP0EP85_9LACO|nr:hypothetical protein R54876_GBNLAHCA_00658 [Lactobacillaceae bacterium LMG 33000]
MKNFLLGVSLVANAGLAYLLLKDEDAVKDLREKADAITDQLSGKAQEIKGDWSGDKMDSLKGNFTEAKGKVKEGLNKFKNQADAADAE